MSCGDKCMHICISSKLFSVATGAARPFRSYIINPNSHVSIRELKIAAGDWESGGKMTGFLGRFASSITSVHLCSSTALVGDLDASISYIDVHVWLSFDMLFARVQISLCSSCLWLYKQCNSRAQWTGASARPQTDSYWHRGASPKIWFVFLMLIFKEDSRGSVLQWLMKRCAPSSLPYFTSYGTGWSDHVGLWITDSYFSHMSGPLSWLIQPKKKSGKQVIWMTIVCFFFFFLIMLWES